MNNIMVSICCITYNQAMYIRQAIDGLLMQKTNFAIEVLIHDDASTDGTTSIIKEYVEKYPEIIKPIYQTENQYSQGKEILTEYIFPRTKGKYIALCEGDDYWIDPLKLQKQVDLLEQHPDINLCFHKTYLKQNGQITKSKKSHLLYPKCNSIIGPKVIIALNGGYIPTASIMFRSELSKELYSVLKDKPVGDIFLQVFLSYPKGAIFINEYMSCYTISSIGSWTEFHNKESIEKKIEFANIVYNGVMNIVGQWDNNVNYNKVTRFLYLNQTLCIISEYCSGLQSFKSAYTRIEPLGKEFFSFLNLNTNKNIIKCILNSLRFIYKIKTIYYAKKYIKQINKTN